MIEHVVAWLARHGISRVVLSLGYKPDAFMAAYPSGEICGVRLGYAVEPELLDTAGAIRFAAAAAAVSSTFLAVNGDVLSDADVGRLVEFHRSRRAEGTILLAPVDDPSAFGVVPTAADGRVTAFVEKPPAASAPTNLINAGCYVLEPSVLDSIPSERRVSIERETFPLLAAEGKLYAVETNAYWIDTGTPVKYIEACLDTVSGRRPAYTRPRVPENPPGRFVHPLSRISGRLEPPVYAAAGSLVEEDAAVSGAVICEAATVGSSASVARSIVMAGAVLGAGAVVEDSVVGPGARLGESCKVTGGSVIGAGAELPAGSRLDSGRFPAP
jgi:mannose-1-phosphate guanylyltransferase